MSETINITPPSLRKADATEATGNWGWLCPSERATELQLTTSHLSLARLPPSSHLHFLYVLAPVNRVGSICTGAGMEVTLSLQEFSKQVEAEVITTAGMK